MVESFHGRWNALAAEMCSESIFLHFVLLYHFPNGWLLHELALEILAGLGAYARFRKLELDWFSSLVGAAYVCIVRGIWVARESGDWTRCVPSMAYTRDRMCTVARPE
jgi:hypothetical protein